MAETDRSFILTISSTAGGRLMRKFLCVSLLATSTGAQGPGAAAQKALESPPARIAPVTDDYFGSTIRDPYRWMKKVDPEFVALGPGGIVRGAILAADEIGV